MLNNKQCFTCFRAIRHPANWPMHGAVPLPCTATRALYILYHHACVSCVYEGSAMQPMRQCTFIPHSFRQRTRTTIATQGNALGGVSGKTLGYGLLCSPQLVVHTSLHPHHRHHTLSEMWGTGTRETWDPEHRQETFFSLLFFCVASGLRQRGTSIKWVGGLGVCGRLHGVRTGGGSPLGQSTHHTSTDADLPHLTQLPTPVQSGNLARGNLTIRRRAR